MTRCVLHRSSSRWRRWFDHAPVPILRAVLGGDPYRGFAVVANRGLIDGLRAELVIEVPVLIETLGAPPAPTAALELVRAPEPAGRAAIGSSFPGW